MPGESDAVNKKEWEKCRRDRLKVAFTNLEKLLPSYDPSVVSTRINVLIKSIEYIQDMQKRIKELLKPKTKINAEVLQLKKLQHRIKRLITRNELLSSLLREAKISIPNEGSSLKPFKYVYKWSNRLNDKTAAILQKKTVKLQESEKENEGKFPDQLPVQAKQQRKMRSKSNSSNLTPKHRKMITKVQNKSQKNRLIQPATSYCFIIYSQACNSQPYYLVSKAPSNQSTSCQTVVTNTWAASNPLMSTNVKTTKPSIIGTVPTMSTLGASTLLLANGTIFPILPTPQPITTTMVLHVNQNSNSVIGKPQIEQNKRSDVSIENNVASTKSTTSTHIIGQKNNSSKANLSVNKAPSTNSITNKSPLKSTVKKTFLPIEPKRCITTTTHVNKVPIPALSSKYSSNIIIPNSPKNVLNKRKVVRGRKIGERPLSRKAFRSLKKMAKMKEKEDAARKNDLETRGNNDKQKESVTLAETNRRDKSVEYEGIKKVSLEQAARDTHDTGLNSDYKEKKVAIISNEVIMKDMVDNSTTRKDSQTNNYHHESMDDKTSDKENHQNKLTEKVLQGNNFDDGPLPQNDVVGNNGDNSNNRMRLESETKRVSSEIISDNKYTKQQEEQTKTERMSKHNTELLGATAITSSVDPENDSECNLNQIKNLDLNLGHSDLSNDIFASLQVPTGCQNPESTSPTAAFLLAFPLVSSLTGVKVTEVIDDENTDSQRETPTLLQIGTIDNTKTTQSDSLTPNLLNLDNLSFFSSKDIYSGFYNSFEQHLNSLTSVPLNNSNELPKVTNKDDGPTNISKIIKIDETPKISTVLRDLNSTTVSKTQPKCDGNTYNGTGESTSLRNRSQLNLQFENKSINDNPPGSDQNFSTNNNSRINDITPCFLKKPAETPNQKSTVEIKNITERTVQEISNTDAQNMMKPAKQSQNFEQNIFNSGLQVQNFNVNLKKGNDSMTSQGGLPGTVFQMEMQNNREHILEKKNEPTNSNLFATQNLTSQKNADVFSAYNSTGQSSQKFSQNQQLPLGENNQFVPISSQPNFSHNLFNINNSANHPVQKNTSYKNYNPNNRQISTSHKSMNTFFNSENKDFQQTSIGKTNNMKNVHGDLIQKNGNYVNFNQENKKNSDTGFSFNLESKPNNHLQKTVETKMQNDNMIYTNMSYDFNGIAKVCTSSYTSNKVFPDPLYTTSNINNYNYYSNSENYINDNCYKNSKVEKSVSTIDFENYTDYRKTDFNTTFYPENNYQKNICSSNKVENVSEKPTYNWMTLPIKNSTDHVIPTISKDENVYSTNNLMNNNQTTYFNTPSMYTGDINNLGQIVKKNFDLPLVNMNTNYPKNDEENQFTWSPTKMPQILDPVPSFVSSTLPTLIGDLALGTSNFVDQRLDVSNRSSSYKDVKKAAPKYNYENQNNLFSVSQLVHQNKEVTPAKSSRRRNSGSGLKTNQVKSKKVAKTIEEHKETQQCFNKSPGSQNTKSENKNQNCRQSNNAVFCDNTKRNSVKVSSTNYSAEALIGHHGHSDVTSKREQIYPSGPIKNMGVPPYMPDNIIPYFPSVELPQDNYLQQNQNFSHNFTTFSNNSYSSNTFIPASTITTPYLSSGTYMSDLVGGQDFSADNMFSHNVIGKDNNNKHKNVMKSVSGGREDKSLPNNVCPGNASKKMKRKASVEANVTPNFVDFSFLSVPGGINSPVLPDDFHSHATFLPHPSAQPQIYPCKNPLYPSKQSNIAPTGPLLPLPPLPSVTKSGVQHPEISPSLNSAGTSLTNFNLSTIFPEMNKSSVNDNSLYVKEQPISTVYGNSSISFTSKTTFSYPHCQTTQSYGANNR